MSERPLSPEEQADIDRLFALSEEGTFYELLGVDPKADRSVIQEAFYDLSRLWHPDRFFRRDVGDYDEKIETVFVSITEAWRTLGNEAGRYTYDLENRDAIDARHAPAPAPRRARPAAGSPAAGSTAGSAAVGGGASSTQAAARRAGRTGRTRRPPSPQRATAPAGAKRVHPVLEAKRQAAMEEMRKKLRARLIKARRYLKEAKEHHEAGRVMKANSAIQLARSFDKKNAEIASLSEQYQREARKLQSKGFVAAAESADSFANYREALANYRKAVDYGTDNARAHYRLGLLTKRVDEDRREALKHMRSAIKMEPDSIEFRMGIGELYEELGLVVNARAQYKRVLALDKLHADAKERLKGLK